MFHPTRAVAAMSLLLGGPGCGGVDTGVVELSWEFVDRDGDKIFPGGLFEDAGGEACDLPGRVGGQDVTYDLGLLLEICDTACPDGCGDPDCLVQAPLRFSCTTYRGSDPSVPSSDDPYRFTARAVLEIDQLDRDCLDPVPTCVAVPGPRDRIVEPGLVTDLQVYQVAVDIDFDANEVLDLEACGCG